MTLPESTPPSQNRIPPFFEKYMRHFHNPPLPSRLYALFIKCGSQNLPHLSRIYPPFLQLGVMRCSQNLPRLPRIYPPPLRNAIFPEYTHPSRIYPLLHHYMRHSHNRPLPPLNIYMRHFQNPPPTQNIPPPPFKHLHATLPEYAPPII